MNNIIITGASGDIGKEIAKTINCEDTNLILIYNKHSIKSFAKNLNADCYKVDLTNEKQIDDFVNIIKVKYKKIDGLVNCAGVSLIKQIQDHTAKDYNFIMDNNFKSVFFLTKQISKMMISNKFGSIVNISSMWGVVGASMESLYSASKGAVNSFTLALSKELGPSNIRVNAICPGLIESKMNKNIDAESLKEIIDCTPLHRIGKPKDVANLVKFLLSEQSSFITGQIISVDGGFSL